MKEAVLFPGQGVAAGDIISYYEKLKAVDEDLVNRRISLAQDSVNNVYGKKEFDLVSALADPASPAFSETRFVQPVVYTLSTLAYDLSKITPDIVAGHSLGEYAALTAASALDVNDGTALVVKRGMFMQEACNDIPSKLVSITGLSSEQVGGLINCESALFNAPDITVVGCVAKDAVKIEEQAKGMGATKTAILDTAGAFHTMIMSSAATRMELELSNIKFSDLQIPIAINLTGEIVQGIYDKFNLVNAMTKPVRWVDVVESIKGAGVESYYEAGPGRSLSVLNRLNGVPREATKNILDPS